MSQVKMSAAQSNAALFGLIDNGQVKEAQDIVTDFTRIRIRESSFFEKIIPSVKLSDDKLTPQLGTDKPVKLVNREPASPGAVTMPFGSQPIQYYIRGDRYPVFFDRLATAKFTKDVTELRTYGYDIRQVISDNAILDMDAELDRKMLAAVDSIIGVEGSTVAATGVVQNRKLIDPLGITRNVLFQAKKVIKQTYAKLENAVWLVNYLFIEDIAAQGRDEVGGDLSQTMYEEGFSQKRLLGVNFVVTNKTELVPDNTIYVFASPEFIGKSFVLEDTTMYLDKRAYLIEFFAYAERGATIGNVAAVVKVRIATS